MMGYLFGDDAAKRLKPSSHGPTHGKVLASVDAPSLADAEGLKRAESQSTYHTLLRNVSGPTVGAAAKSKDGQPDVYGNDELYFGSLKVHLAPVPGSVIGYRHEDWKPMTDQESLQRVLARAEKMGPKDDIIVPAIPALDFGTNDSAVGKEDLSAWPDFLRTPLIKVGKNIPENMFQPLPGGVEKAFASGVRSCTLKLDGKWYRLKGAGNNDEGFVVKSELNSAGKFTRQLRGSAWFHTAVRENYMVAQLASTMRPQGMSGANDALGVYLYDSPNQPFGPDVSVPACVVERTYGDRRLGTHVCAGIELLLPLLLDTSLLNGDNLKSVFPPARQELPTGGDVVVSTAALMTDHMMALEFICAGMMEPGTHGLEFNVPRDNSCLVEGASVPLPYRKLEQGVYPAQWTLDGSKEMGPEWKPLWDKCVTDYNEGIDKVGKKSVLGYLFSRFGKDCGRIMKGMHDVNVSWGTYQDEICVDDSQWHCNAHANNMVVLTEGISEDMFLGYLDLDMAFDDATFVSVYGKGSPIGTVGINQEEHAKLLKREHVNFLEVLAGADTTSGVPMVAKAEMRSHPKYQELEAVKSIFYDGLVLAYMNAYSGDDSKFPTPPYDAELHQMARTVMKLAIMVMADFVA